MCDGKLYDVFLSHNAMDKEAVEALARRLTDEAGVKPWLDKWNVVPGEGWQEKTEQALDDARACAVFLGPNGMGPWQHEEMRAALLKRVERNDFRVIPVLLPGADSPARAKVPSFLFLMAWVNFNVPAGLNDEEALHQLVAGIRGVPPGPLRTSLRQVLADGAEASLRTLVKVRSTLLTIFFAAASANLAVDVGWRFLRDGGEGLSPAESIVRGLLLALFAIPATFAAATFTAPGRAWVERVLTRTGLSERRKGRHLLIISASAFVLALVAWLSLPRVAGYYNERGLSSRRQDDLTTAARLYRRAISLHPAYAPAHYNLAAVYEDWQRRDDAISEYSRAVELDSGVGEPWNNLGRLYILRGTREDLAKALALLDEGLRRTLVAEAIGQSPPNTPLLYALYKNRGWVKYKLGEYPAAEKDLRHAVVLRDKGEEDQGASAHCLLGYVLRDLKNPEAADRWYDCISYSEGEFDIEPEWLIHAEQSLREGAAP